MERRTSLIIQMHEGYDWPGAVAHIVDHRGLDWYLVSVEVVREVRRKAIPGILSASLRMGCITLWSRSSLSPDCRERLDN